MLIINEGRMDHHCFKALYSIFDDNRRTTFVSSTEKAKVAGTHWNRLLLITPSLLDFLFVWKQSTGIILVEV